MNVTYHNNVCEARMIHPSASVEHYLAVVIIRGYIKIVFLSVGKFIQEVILVGNSNFIF